MQVSSKTNDHNYNNSNSSNNNKNKNKKKKKAIQQKHRKTRASSRRRQLLGSGHRCPYPSRCSQSKMLEGFKGHTIPKHNVVLVIFPNFTSAATGPGHCHNMIDKELNNMMVLHYEGYDALHLAQRWTSSNAILINVR